MNARLPNAAWPDSVRRHGTHPPVSGEATVAFTLDGQAAFAVEGESILHAARRHGVDIPHLCHSDGLRPDGNCRSCVVEVAGERVLAASCCRAVTPGLEVKAQSERAIKSQRLVLELLAADVAAPDQAGELSQWLERTGVRVRPALKALQRAQPAPDLSHPAMAVNLDACIQCTRCVRACREEQVNDVIGMALRGAHTQVVFDLGDPMGASSCVACGECVQACPTGALSVKAPGAARETNGALHVDREVDSVCPFCGVGCLLTYQIQDATDSTPERIVAVQGRDGPANAARLCVKGRFGFDYAHHPDRLTRPLIRIDGVAKDPAHITAPPDWRAVFREASWDEALAFAAGGLKRLREHHGPVRWPASARPKAATKRPICSRSWCAPRSAPTTSTTAPACATPPAWPRCWRAWARAR
jgi:formate dehydrogenase major subunit